MNLITQKFEAIKLVLQDTTGFEEARTFRDTSIQEIEENIPDGFLKEIHLINPIEFREEKHG
jgi:hypothetical protein